GGEAGSAHVLDTDDEVLIHELEASLHQATLELGIADHRPRGGGGAFFVEFVGGHHRRVDALTASSRTDGDDEHARFAGGAPEDAIAAKHAHDEAVDQAVAVVAGIEAELAADHRQAHAPAVLGHAPHGLKEDLPRARMRRSAVADRVEGGDRPGTHGE